LSHPPTDNLRRLTAQCCIVGGGPAGMMLGLLLARAGVEVVVLEKHADFLRDFRGDTIHPSTLDVIGELGLLDDFLSRPHQEVRELVGYIGNERVPIADFSRLKTRCQFIALMPQWDFLDFLSGAAHKYPTFHLHTQSAVDELIFEGDRVGGVRASTPDGPLEVCADLTVGADGRNSIVRAQAQLPVRDVGAPIDVLWLRLSRKPDDPDVPAGRFDRGRVFVMIYRGDYWQCGYVIPKGGHDEIRRRGLAAFRQSIVDIAPFVADRIDELADWDAIKLLTVKVDRLLTWHRLGLLCIGDAAHAMSPVGGVGINLAIQDAVAAANALATPLRENRVDESILHSIERRREWPTRVTQWLQVQVQNRILGRVLTSTEPLGLPWPARLLRRWPIFRRIPAYLVGVGLRPEHVETPDAFAIK
jgi:2-polyprenyl-6-methoxyphenol hydroxylase-like FAD-dependent oxidoreductase